MNSWEAGVPPNWSRHRLKWCFRSCRNGVWGEEPDGENDIVVVRVADFDRIGFRVRLEHPTMRAITPHERETRLLKNSDLLIEKSGGGELQPVGFVVSYEHDEPAVCSNFVARLEVSEHCEPRFLTYLNAHLYSNGVNQRSIKQTTGIQNLDAESYLNELVTVPDKIIQRRIAHFLDSETAEIDALIAEKQRMLVLLEEKRVALVTHAVTVGLHPTTDRTASGFDYLGDIPAHWSPRRLKFLIEGVDQGWSPQCFNYPADDGCWGVLKTGCVNRGIFREQENKALPDDIEPPSDIEVHVGDVLMSRASGSVDLIGNVARVMRQPSARLLLSDKTYRLLPNGELLDADFLVAVMGSTVLRHQIKAFISGAEGLANNIARTDIGELIVPLPPVDEQRDIVAYIARETSDASTLNIDLTRSVSLLMERRSALISAAVTGQMPVEEMAT